MSVYVKVAVVCVNANGEPDIHTCSPEVTEEQIDNGHHYDLAKQNAVFNGYREPMIAFDLKDDAAQKLLETHRWMFS